MSWQLRSAYVDHSEPVQTPTRRPAIIAPTNRPSGRNHNPFDTSSVSIGEQEPLASVHSREPWVSDSHSEPSCTVAPRPSACRLHTRASYSCDDRGEQDPVGEPTRGRRQTRTVAGDRIDVPVGTHQGDRRPSTSDESPSSSSSPTPSGCRNRSRTCGSSTGGGNWPCPRLSIMFDCRVDSTMYGRTCTARSDS